MANYHCKICNIGFQKFQDKANHIRWQHKDNSEYFLKLKEITKKSNEKRFGKWVNEVVYCYNPNCKQKTKIKYREGKKREKYFCSRSCANSRGPRSKETRDKISNSVSSAWKNGLFNEIDYTSSNKRFSSKIEREIVKHFKEKYPEDLWKSGGRKKLNENVYMSRDLYSDKLKICFEYDGIWHFEDIRGQLKDKQMKDLELEKWCILNQYRLIRIDEECFESIEQIEKLIYDSDEMIIKIGKRY